MLGSGARDGDQPLAQRDVGRGRLPAANLTQAKVGRGHHFEGIEGASMVDLHDQFLHHVQHYCQWNQSR